MCGVLFLILTFFLDISICLPYHKIMEEYPYSPKQNKSEKPAFLKTRLFKIIFAVIVLLLLTGIFYYFHILSGRQTQSLNFSIVNQVVWILNYFNILPVFRTFPKQQIQQKNTVSSQGNTDFCRTFSSFNNSVKITCQKAVEIALADTQGKPIKIGFGPLQLEPALVKTLERQKIAIPKTSAWIIEIVLNKPITLQGGKEATSIRIQIPADGTRAIYRTPISIWKQNC